MMENKKTSLACGIDKTILNKSKILRDYLPKAFSLIELMISLIVVSCITAAFTPVITKKLKSGSLIAGSVGDAFRNSKMGLEDCKEYAGIDNCMFCDIKKKECKICAGSACDVTHQYTVSKDCTCGECSNLFTDCARCTEQKCEACIAGKYFDNNSCKPVSDYPGCEGSKCYTDPNADPPVINPKPCPDGSICPNGKKIDCTTAELTHKLCKDGEAGTCPDGSICTNGKEIKCTTAELTHKQCKNGVAGTCPEGYTCDNGKPTTCASKPVSTWCVNGTTQNCPEGYTCSGGKATSCSGKPPSTWCVNGATQTCPEGNTCSSGKKTPCTGVASTVRCLNGTTTTCGAGYYCVNGVQPNSQCKSGCATCSSASSCSECATGSYLSGGNCLTCPANSTCSSTGFTCSSGYWSNGSSCPSCDTRCITCTGAGYTNCTSCKNGYWKSGNTCNSCPTGASCNGVNVTSCPVNTWLSSNSCISCPAHASCSGGTSSYICETNWSGTGCSTYTPPCTWGWWVGSTKYSSENGSWSCSWTYNGNTYCVVPGRSPSECGNYGCSNWYTGPYLLYNRTDCDCNTDGSGKSTALCNASCTGTKATWTCK